MMEFVRKRLVLAIVVLAAIVGGVVLLTFGCNFGEQLREPMTDAVKTAVQPFTLQEFWYGAARGILRAWVEVFPPTPTPAGEGWLANADGPAAIMAYLLIHRVTPFRRLADWIKGEGEATKP